LSVTVPTLLFFRSMLGALLLPVFRAGSGRAHYGREVNNCRTSPIYLSTMATVSDAIYVLAPCVLNVLKEV